MEIRIRKYSHEDLPEIIRIWNEVVEEGTAFPQEECLDMESGKAFFDGQSYCGVVISATPAMQSVQRAGDCISVKNW